MAMATKTIDVRRFKRVFFKRPVKVKPQGQEVFEGNLAQDLSQGGVRVFASEFVPLNSLVTVQVQLKDASKVLELQGRVAWVRFNPFSEDYQIGLEFAGDKLRTCEVIGRFIRSL